jgi:hypothetical protein
MFFIGGIAPGMKQLNYMRTVICRHCGSYGRYQVYMTYLCFSFFFIPLIRWNRHYYVKMSCCGALYELDPAVGRAIARGEDIEIREEDLTPVSSDGCGNYFDGWNGGRGDAWNGGTGAIHRRCPNCGYETDEDFDFCPKCGSRLDEVR